ncbi:MAG: hypothetical protein NDJ19_09185 [Ramlibacter sp.]|nr:hypothetical protein [Ramlibacter sp.]
MSTQPAAPAPDPDEPQAADPKEGKSGSNAVEHEPDPKARPVPDGEPRYVPRSPYTTGND